MTEFEQLFNKNRDFIFKFLMKMSRNASTAEELTQETFFRAYINYASLRNKENASPWLCQIAKNAYYAWYKEQKKTERLDQLEAIDNGECIEELFSQKELSQNALRCLLSIGIIGCNSSAHYKRNITQLIEQKQTALLSDITQNDFTASLSLDEIERVYVMSAE